MPLTAVEKTTPTTTTEPATVQPTAQPFSTITLPPLYTITSLPVPTSTAIPPTVSLPTKTNIPDGICNLAAFEADVNYADNSVVAAGNNFDKKWRLRNNGTCTWTSGYKVVFVSGDAMSGAGSVQLTNGTVPPGNSVTVSVNLTAPAAPGTYRGNYKLQASDGNMFGIDPAGSVFYVQIVVENANGDVPAGDDEANDGGGDDSPASNAPALTRYLKLSNPYLRGDDVLSLQKKLLARGYNIVGSADGVFGKKTDAAVRQFQSDQGLVVDGVVGPKTWSALWN
jgi:hypothetical protein